MKKTHRIGAAVLAFIAAGAHAQGLPIQKAEEPLPLAATSVVARPLAQPEMLPIETVPAWIVKPGDRIRATLEAWAGRAGWMVRWVPAGLDYTADGGFTYHGDFKTATRRMFKAIPFDDLEPKFRVHMTLIADNTPPMVLVTRDDGVNKGAQQ